MFRGFAPREYDMCRVCRQGRTHDAKYPCTGVNATGDAGDTQFWSAGDEVPYIPGKVRQVSAVAC